MLVKIYRNQKKTVCLALASTNLMLECDISTQLCHGSSNRLVLFPLCRPFINKLYQIWLQTVSSEMGSTGRITRYYPHYCYNNTKNTQVPNMRNQDTFRSYHEMRTQTLHLLKCQSPWTSLQADHPLTRMGLTMIPATKSEKEIKNTDKPYKSYLRRVS